ncbi:MAG: carbon storage regulator CsrA [Leifsonia sp.]
MLVLTRKIGERILIGDDIIVTVLDVRGDNVRIGIEAPGSLRIQRDEVVRAVEAANVEAAEVTDDATAGLVARLAEIAGRPDPES